MVVTPGLIRGSLDDGGPAGNSRSSPVPAFDRTEYALQIVLPTSGLSVVVWWVQQGQAARLAGAGAGAETLCFWLGCTEESKPSLLDTHTPGRSSDRSFLVHVRGSCICPPPNNLQTDSRTPDTTMTNNDKTNNDNKTNGKRKRKTFKQRYCKMSSEFRQITALSIDDLRHAPCIAFGQRVADSSMTSSTPSTSLNSASNE